MKHGVRGPWNTGAGTEYEVGNSSPIYSLRNIGDMAATCFFAFITLEEDGVFSLPASPEIPIYDDGLV